MAVVARHGDDRDPDADGPSEDDLFLEAVGDVEPLEDRGRVREPRRKRRTGKASRPASFTVERDGDRIEGRAHGVSHRQLVDLVAGHSEPESQLDLHRHDRDAARQALERFIAGAAASGQRLVLVIHGRGRHSGGAPVIKEEVVTTLCRGATGRSVRGFCSARARHGGTGALYVLLKS